MVSKKLKSATKKRKQGKGNQSSEDGKRRAAWRKQDLSKGLMGEKVFSDRCLGEACSRGMEVISYLSLPSTAGFSRI